MYDRPELRTSQESGEAHSLKSFSQPPILPTQMRDPLSHSGTCAQTSWIEPSGKAASNQGSEYWQKSSPVLTPLEWQKTCSMTDLQRLEEAFLCLDNPIADDANSTEISNETDGWPVGTEENGSPRAGDTHQIAEYLCFSHVENGSTTQHNEGERPPKFSTNTDNHPTTNTQYISNASSHQPGTKVTAKQFLAKNKCDTCGGPVAKPQEAKHLSEKIPQVALWCHPGWTCWSGGMNEALADPSIQSEISRLGGDTAISYRLVRHGLPHHTSGGRRNYTGTRQKNRVVSSHVFCPCVKCGTRIFWGKNHFINQLPTTLAVSKPTKTQSMICRACG